MIALAINFIKINLEYELHISDISTKSTIRKKKKYEHDHHYQHHHHSAY